MKKPLFAWVMWPRLMAATVVSFALVSCTAASVVKASTLDNFVATMNTAWKTKDAATLKSLTCRTKVDLATLDSGEQRASAQAAMNTLQITFTPGHQSGTGEKATATIQMKVKFMDQTQTSNLDAMFDSGEWCITKSLLNQPAQRPAG